MLRKRYHIHRMVTRPNMHAIFAQEQLDFEKATDIQLFFGTAVERQLVLQYMGDHFGQHDSFQAYLILEKQPTQNRKF